MTDSLLQLAASLEAGSPHRVRGDDGRAAVTDNLTRLVEQLAEATGSTRREAQVELMQRITDSGAAGAMDYIRSVLGR